MFHKQQLIKTSSFLILWLSSNWCKIKKKNFFFNLHFILFIHFSNDNRITHKAQHATRKIHGIRSGPGLLHQFPGPQGPDGHVRQNLASILNRTAPNQIALSIHQKHPTCRQLFGLSENHSIQASSQHPNVQLQQLCLDLHKWLQIHGRSVQGRQVQSQPIVHMRAAFPETLLQAAFLPVQ